MAFQDLISWADRFGLAQFGEPVTLEYETTSVTVQAVVDVAETGAETHYPITSRGVAATLTMTDASAAGVTAAWSAIYRGQRREIIYVSPPGNGMTTVLLGNQE